MQNKKRILIIVSSILILITIIGLSYAYFAANIIGNEEVSSIAGRAAYLEVTFADGEDTITGNNIVPGWSASKTFTVTNTGENKTYYNLKVVNITNTFTIPGSISLSISSNDGGKNVEKMVLPASDEVIARSIPIELNGVHHYTVTAYYNNLDVDQIDDLNKTFSFDITIENAQKAEPQGWSSAPSNSLLAGIKKTYPAVSEPWTVPGRQTPKKGDVPLLTIFGSKPNYYWTFGEAYTIINDSFSLSNPSTCVYSSCYRDLIGKYIVGATVEENSEETNVMKATSGLANIYRVLSASEGKILIEKYNYLARGTSDSYKYWTYGTGVESASTTTTAIYNLTGVNVIDYDKEYEKLIGNYIVSTSLSDIASDNQTVQKETNNINYIYEIIDATPNYIIYKSAVESSFGKTEDDYGTSYYYRGAVDNNYLVFANMCWRIVRIDGQGNTKITLYNYNPSNATNPCDKSLDAPNMAFARYDSTTDGQKGYSSFNTNIDRNTYVGFMYSNNPNSIEYLTAHANDVDSTILTNLKKWYDEAFTQTDKEKLADVIWCNDKRVVSDTTFNPTTDPYASSNGILGTGLGRDKSFYQATRRLFPSSEAVPSLKCGTSKMDNLISKFTASTLTDGGYGNGNLNGYKIGLLTIDEIIFAGTTSQNSASYLYNNAYDKGYWTMTPHHFSGNDAYNYVLYYGNSPANAGVTGSDGVRPTVSLKANTTISGGNGTQDNPFVVS